MSKKKFTALGAYIFAGGFTVGVRKHFQVLAHFEDGPYGVETAQHNLPELRGNVFIDPATWPTKRFKNKVDFVYGNPPCAPWSVCSAGRATHWTEDPRLNCVKRQWSLIDALNPDAWAWESVRPAWTKGRELVETIVRQANERGYHATALFVEGTRHGVPQRRPRFFLVLHKYAITWQPTGINEPPTVGDTLKTKFKSQTVAPIPINQLPNWLLKKLKPGMRASHIFSKRFPEKIREAQLAGTKVRGRPGFQKMRLDPDKVCCTITGGAQQLHPHFDRYLSVEESAALCGYPRDFVFKGGTNKQYAQVAQAVMPPVGEYLARMVAASLAKRVCLRKPGFERVEIFVDKVESSMLINTGGSMSLDVIEPVKVTTPKPLRPVTRTGREPRLRSPTGSGYRIRQLLVKGIATETILKTIHLEFPQSKAKASDVYWNKRKLEAQGGVP